jgi:MazG family protein
MSPVERLRAVSATLRSCEGCPWDREQTLESLKPFLVEEAYEVLDAIEEGNRDTLRDELGDLLLQIVFQSQLCEEEGSFTFDDVAGAIVEKLIRRHPHVFGDVQVEDAAEVLRNWDAIKRTEKGETAPKSALAGVPRHLPALQRAFEIQKRASRRGFDWDEIKDVIAKVSEEVSEFQEAVRAGAPEEVSAELGDLLFSLVNLSRFLNVEPEEALQRANGKFIRRFQAVEKVVHAQDRALTDCSPEELDEEWERVKGEERA